MMDIGGKIFVVALVLALIFVGLALFLFYIERKLKRMEHQIDKLEHKEKLKSNY